MNPSLYPSFNYIPQMQHCAFGLNMLGPLAEYVDDERLPDDARIERFDAFLAKVSGRFPRHEEFPCYDAKDWRACKRFTGMREEVSYAVSDSRIVMTHMSAPFASSLLFEADNSYLKSDLHNAATPNLALVMYFHALPALKKIYRAYGIDAGILPEITFDHENDFMFSIPFWNADVQPGINKIKIENYATKIPYKVEFVPVNDFYGRVILGGTETEIAPPLSSDHAGRFVGRIGYKGRNNIRRSVVATHLFIMNAMQAETLCYQ